MLLATDQDPCWWAHKLHINFFQTKHRTGKETSNWMAQSSGAEALFWHNDILVSSTRCYSCRLLRVLAVIPLGRATITIMVWLILMFGLWAGEEFSLRVERSTLGSEVRKMVLDHLPARSGAKLVLDHMKHQTSEQGGQKAVRLKLHQTLQEQGLAEAETAILCCTYVPTQLQAAWCFLRGFETPEAELSLEGVTHLTHPHLVLAFSIFPKALSVWLLVMTSTRVWNTWPCLTVCRIWLLAVASTRVWNAWPCLTVCRIWLLEIASTKSLERVTLPNSLQNLTFGSSFNQSLEWRDLASQSADLTFGFDFNQSLERVTLPNSLQNLTFG